MDKLQELFGSKSNEGIFGMSIKQAVLGLFALWISQYILKILYKTFIWYPLLSHHKNLPGPDRPSYIRGNLGKILESEPGVIHKAWREEHGTAMRYARQSSFGANGLSLIDSSVQWQGKTHDQ